MEKSAAIFNTVPVVALTGPPRAGLSELKRKALIDQWNKEAKMLWDIAITTDPRMAENPQSCKAWVAELAATIKIEMEGWKKVKCEFCFGLGH